MIKDKIKQWLVIKLVRWADRGWTASYSAYVRCDRDGFPSWYQKPWTWLACRIDHVMIRLTRKLDPDNKWTAQEMVEHGWWG